MDQIIKFILIIIVS